MRTELDLRNLKPAAVMDYLVEAGGVINGDRSATGPGWRAELTPLPAITLGVMRIPRDLLIIEGDDDAVRQVTAHLRFRTMRGGG